MFCLDNAKLPNKDTSLPTKFTNFFAMDFLIDTNEIETDVPHRPGKLYKFNYEKYKKKKKKWGGIDF